jgi:hypothetical protein
MLNATYNPVYAFSLNTNFLLSQHSLCVSYTLIQPVITIDAIILCSKKLRKRSQILARNDFFTRNRYKTM